MSVGLALCSLSGYEPKPVDLALIGQSAEHDYAGVNCGIMDQLISAMGEAGHALLIDCASLETTQVAIPPSEGCIVVCDTRVRHSLAASGYNDRRAECEQAVALLKKQFEMQTLSDLSVQQLAAAEAQLPPLLMKRARHVVRENERTRGAVDALRNGHLPGLGRMMTGSHISLRDDYEVSCKELDFIVDEALKSNAVLGARMTGGGFGGSAVLLVRRDGVDSLRERIHAAYRAQFRSEPYFFVTEASDGMRAEREVQDEG
jgi:galactokinase